MKKIICLVLALITLMPFSVMAEEHYDKGTATTTAYQEGTYFGESDGIALAADYSKEMSALASGIARMSDIIYIPDPTVRASEYAGIMREVINSNPEFFYVGTLYSYYYSKDEEDKENPVVLAIKPTYIMSTAEAKAKIGRMRQEASKIINTCIDDSMTDYTKLLEIHDYFCLNYEYDTTLQKHSAYDILVDKKGVCEAYSLAYKYVVSRIGINCDYAASDAMNHIRNMVEIDNNWFHVDVTWDDPVPNVNGRARHQYFMVDDETFKEEGHYDWVSQHIADNATYKNSPMRNIDSAVYYKNGKYYHIDDLGNLCCSSDICKGDCQKKYKSGSKYYIADKAGYFYKKMSYIVEYNGCFYFSEADGVYKLDYSDENAVPIRVYTSKNNQYPVDLIITNGRLKFHTATLYTEGRMVYSQPMMYSTEYDGLFGDADDNSTVDITDAVIIANSTVDDQVISDKGYKLGDVDGNARVSMIDAIRVAQNTLGAEF